MIAFFVRPWEILKQEETIEISGSIKTFQEVRKQLYENIVDEAMFISRASEGSVSLEWIMSQPIFVRKKYLEQFQKEMKERKERLDRRGKK